MGFHLSSDNSNEQVIRETAFSKAAADGSAAALLFWQDDPFWLIWVLHARWCAKNALISIKKSASSPLF
jgi:hypothetical protein